MLRYYGWYARKMRAQRMKRAEEEAARESVATAEQGCGEGASTVIEIIEHRAHIRHGAFYRVHGAS